MKDINTAYIPNKYYEFKSNRVYRAYMLWRVERFISYVDKCLTI